MLECETITLASSVYEAYTALMLLKASPNLRIKSSDFTDLLEMRANHFVMPLKYHEMRKYASNNSLS